MKVSKVLIAAALLMIALLIAPVSAQRPPSPPKAPWMYKLWFDDTILDYGLQLQWWDASVAGDTLVACFWKVYAVPYGQDGKIYHYPDYYAKASETIANNAGDCEDKAILFASTAYNTFSKDPKVVFGTILNRGHAWVEIDDIVYDPTLGVIMSTSTYYNTYGASWYMWFDSDEHGHTWSD